MTDIVTASIIDALELGADFDLDDTSGPENIPGWDSFGWIKIIGLIEERSNLELPLERLADAKSVGDLKVIIQDQQS